MPRIQQGPLPIAQSNKPNITSNALRSLAPLINAVGRSLPNMMPQSQQPSLNASIANPWLPAPQPTPAMSQPIPQSALPPVAVTVNGLAGQM